MSMIGFGFELIAKVAQPPRPKEAIKDRGCHHRIAKHAAVDQCYAERSLLHHAG
ncbi:hypothetical protein NKH55_30630 [Mesorhizobium opportunistum]|uniref:hypothetical protein n=1 Tax=Mesorhizobium opportunistum TaxID=593909 RepID=UPI00333832D5